MQIDESSRLTGFQEKPEDPITIPGNNYLCLASTGIYIFSARVLFDLLCRDANLPHSSHDFGRDIIPSMIKTHKVTAFPFECVNNENAVYWRDVGTLDSYYQANMDLIAVDPPLNVYDKSWPIRTCLPILPPPKFVFGSKPSRTLDPSRMAFPTLAKQAQASDTRIGCALDSIVSDGSIISGAVVERSVIGREVMLHENAIVSDSILLDGVIVGKNATVKRAIVDKDVIIPADTRIGVSVEEDKKRGFTITEGGITVIAKGDRIETTTRSQTAVKKWHVKSQNQVFHDH